MNDWYTPEVKAALDIVPVEWVRDSGVKKRLCTEPFLTTFKTQYLNIQGEWISSGGQFCPAVALALIEKAFREWLEARDYILYWDSYMGETYVQTMANAVLHAEPKKGEQQDG